MQTKINNAYLTQIKPNKMHKNSKIFFKSNQRSKVYDLGKLFKNLITFHGV